VLATRTFLFSDLRDFTPFVERHGDAAAARALTEYWQRAKATWYLGRLTDWARGLGVAADTR
jgi:hypothetical protein